MRQRKTSCVLQAFGLVLLDHVIVGESEHYSYSDSGRLKELENE